MGEWYNKKQAYNKVSSTERSTKRGFINVKLHISQMQYML